MKKIITILLSFVLLLSMTMTAFAADNQTEISLTLDETMESYELVIAPTITITPGSTEEIKVPLNVNNVNLVWSKQLSVYVNSAHPDTESNLGAFLVNTTDSNKKIHYKMYSGMGPDYEGTEMETYRYYYSESSKAYTYVGGGVSIQVDGTYPGSGTYTDTLTYRVVTQ